MQQFTAIISVILVFTREEVEYLATCAEHHYDHTVKMLVPPGEGALINGMRTRLLDPATTEQEGEYHFREVSLLYKAIEFEDDILAMRLKRRLHKAMDRINIVGVAVNGLLDAFPYQPLE